MLVGFISLLLTIGQNPISNICVSKKVAGSWHPCSSGASKNPSGVANAFSRSPSETPQFNYSSPPAGRKLLLETDRGPPTPSPPLYYNQNLRRELAGSGVDKCSEKASNSIHYCL